MSMLMACGSVESNSVDLTDGLTAYQNKWAEEALVDNLTTIEECQQFMVQ